MVKATKGRQKIQMEKMKNESNLQVTFSKRRTGLFKKASELSTLCGVDIAIIVFSPGGKAYSFGHPSVEAITDRFLSNNHNNQPQTSQHHHLPNSTIQLIEASRNNTVRELNYQLTQVTEQLDMEKMRGEQLNKALEACGVGGGGRPTVEEMNLTQLQEFRLQLENLKIQIAKQAEETSLQNLNPHSLMLFNNPLSILPQPQLHHHQHQHQQQLPWSSLPHQLQTFPSSSLLSPPSLGMGVGPSSSVVQPLSTNSVVNVNANAVAPQNFWGNLVSSSSSSSMPMAMPQVLGLGLGSQVEARNDDYNNNPGTSGAMTMQPRNLGMMNFGSGIGSSSRQHLDLD